MSQTYLLIVMGEPSLGDAYYRKFKNFGYKVKLVCNGKEALETATAEMPDLMILDGRLPEIDGFEVCKKLKDDSRTQNIKIIIHSARTQPSEIKEGLEAGADLYVTFPVGLPELKRILDNARKDAEFPNEAILKIDAVHAPK